MKILGDQGFDTGKVRKARKVGRCQECDNVIIVGEKYVVGSQKDYSRGPYAYKHLCGTCAEEYGMTAP